MTCPGFEQLLDYADERLDRLAAETIATHLAGGCGECDGDSAWYQRVKLVAASDDSIEPPPWVLKRALRLFNAPRAQMNIGARAARLVGTLVFDSLRRQSLAGARSGGLEARQLLYRAEDYSIDVQVSPSDQRRVGLTGQILRVGDLMFESVAGLRLDFTRDDGSTLSTVTNDRGEFTIPAIDPGSYDLLVDANDASITIVGLPIAK